jgi:hypothetical protein
LLAPQVDIIYGADFQWWEHYEFQWAELQGVMRYTCNHRAAKRFGAVYMPLTSKDGLSEDGLSSGNNSGHQAVSLAYWLGAAHIDMLGFDMMADETGKRHFFGDHTGQNLDNPSEDRFRRWRQSMTQLIKEIRAKGVTVRNLTQDSALNV